MNRAVLALLLLLCASVAVADQAPSPPPKKFPDVQNGTVHSYMLNV